jgi:hypothetical protein
MGTSAAEFDARFGSVKLEDNSIGTTPASLPDKGLVGSAGADGMGTSAVSPAAESDARFRSVKLEDISIDTR